MFQSRSISIAIGFLACQLVASASNGGEDAETLVRTATISNGFQPIVARTDSQGTIHVAVQSKAGPAYVRSTDNGKTFSRPLMLVDKASQQPNLEYLVWDMVAAPNGRVHVAMGTNAWKLKLPQEEWGFFYTTLEPGANEFAPVRNINRKPSEGFSLAADGRDRVTACWLSDKLYANVSLDGGKTFGPMIEIDADFDPCNCCTTSATYGADGKLAVLYREEKDNERDMYLVLWDQESGSNTRSRVSSTPWKIDACPMTYYSIQPRDNGYVAAWPTKGKIYFGTINQEGSKEEREIVEIQTPGMSGMRTGIMALTNPSGNTLVAWKNDERLAWQVYDKKNRPIGKTGSAKSPGNGAAAVIDRDGQFVVIP